MGLKVVTVDTYKDKLLTGDEAKAIFERTLQVSVWASGEIYHLIPTTTNLSTTTTTTKSLVKRLNIKQTGTNIRE